MAKMINTNTAYEPVNKKTSQGRKNLKMSSMNKNKRRSFKKYRGQGK